VKEIAEQQKNTENTNSADPLSQLTPAQLKATQENLPIFLEAIWHVSVVDIERTLTAAITKVTRDHAVEESIRLRRGEAIALIGAIFMEEALTAGGSKNPKEKVTEMVQMIAPHMAPKPNGAEPNGGAASSGGGAAGGSSDSSRANGEAADAKLREHTIEELRSMKVRELKTLLHQYGVSEVEAVEKEELVEVIFALQQSSAGDNL